MRIITLFITIIFSVITFAQSNTSYIVPTHKTFNKDSTSYMMPDKKPWRALAIGTGLNLGIFGFNRFVMKEDFAYINLKTIGRNLKTVPVWDTDFLSTNFIGHPYQGGLNFTAARANGYSFYESIPFTFINSLVWEFALENEPPSRNDITSTPIGGAAIGEVTFRLSDLILDNRATGSDRFMREFFAAIIAPTRFINRWITGEINQHGPRKGNYLPEFPFLGKVSVSGRSAIDNDKRQRYGINATAEIFYGEPFGYEAEKPFEWFDLKSQLGVIASNFSLTEVSILAPLRTFELYEKNNWQIYGGLFQHFKYFNPKVTISENDEFLPFYISEPAAAGFGLLVRKETRNFDLQARLFANGILLGASKSDYFNLDNRDYNIGSGFSLKAMAEVSLYDRVRLKVKAEDYNLYSWKGYDKDLNFDEFTKYEISHLNTQGERGVARMYYLSLNAECDITSNSYIGIERNRYIRHTRYKEMPNVKYAAWDNMIHIGYKF